MDIFGPFGFSDGDDNAAQSSAQPGCFPTPGKVSALDLAAAWHLGVLQRPSKLDELKKRNGDEFILHCGISTTPALSLLLVSGEKCLLSTDNYLFGLSPAGNGSGGPAAVMDEPRPPPRTPTIDTRVPSPRIKGERGK